MSKTIQQIVEEQRQASKIHQVSEAYVNRALANDWKKDNPEFSQTMQNIASQRGEEYHKAFADGIASRDKTYQAKVNNRPEVKAKLSKALTGVPKTAEHRKNLKATTTNKPGNANWEAAHAAGLANRDRPFWAGEYSEQISAPFPSRAAAARYAKEHGLGNAVKKMEVWTKKFPQHYFFMD